MTSFFNNYPLYIIVTNNFSSLKIQNVKHETQSTIFCVNIVKQGYKTNIYSHKKISFQWIKYTCFPDGL